jgi:hypothetical protein
MALEPLQLDNLTWEGMVAAIRRRIAAASQGQWTLHAAVDPGVTLLELYAWLLEQRLFWLDQTPDEMVRGALALLGLEPSPERSAGTVFAFDHQKAAATSVPARTEFVLSSPGSSLVFATMRALEVLSVTGLAVHTGKREITADLASQRAVELFAPEAPDLTITLQLASAPSGGATGLLVGLQTSAKIAPQWAELGRRVPDASPLRWQYSAVGGFRDFAPGSLHDGTAGFRRSGVIRFTIPPDWSAPYRARVSVRENRFASPPRLTAVHANAELAFDRRIVRHAFTVDWLPLPGNRLDVSELPAQSPLKDVPVMQRSLQLEIREPDNVWRRWRRRPDLAGAGAADRVFVFDAERSAIVFGNGIAGRIPRVAKDSNPNVRAAYRVGGGTRGNVPANRAWESRLRSAGGGPLWRTVNPVAAQGGEDAESVSAARTRAGAFLRQTERAILRTDFTTLAETTSGAGIARARAAIGHHPCFPCERVPGAVTVFVVPEAPRPEYDDEPCAFTFVPAPVPDPGQIAAIAARLEDRRLIGSEVYVRPPSYRAVHVILEAAASAAFYDELKLRLCRVIRRVLDPLGGLSGRVAEAYPFGQPVRPSSLRREAQAALGRDGEVQAVRIGLDGATPEEPCGDVAIGPNDLVYLAAFDLTLHPPKPNSRGLR